MSCAGCGQPCATDLCCPKCAQIGQASFFCSQACFAKNWKKHCVVHAQAAPKPQAASFATVLRDICFGKPKRRRGDQKKEDAGGGLLGCMVRCLAQRSMLFAIVIAVLVFVGIVHQHAAMVASGGVRMADGFDHDKFMRTMEDLSAKVETHEKMIRHILDRFQEKSVTPPPHHDAPAGAVPLAPAVHNASATNQVGVPHLEEMSGHEGEQGRRGKRRGEHQGTMFEEDDGPKDVETSVLPDEGQLGAVAKEAATAP